MFCKNCGKEINDDASFCPYCGTRQGIGRNEKSSRSLLAAGLLAFFLGSLGIHNFYLGYTAKGVIQLLLTVIGWVIFGIGPIISGIWAFIEAILIFMGRIQDSDGKSLR